MRNMPYFPEFSVLQVMRELYHQPYGDMYIDNAPPLSPTEVPTRTAHACTDWQLLRPNHATALREPNTP